MTFAGSVVALGALGVTTRVALRIQPTFRVRQYVFDDIAHATVRERFDEAFGAAYSVSFFTTWAPELTGRAWVKGVDGVDPPWDVDAWLGGSLAAEERHPLPGHDAVNCTDQQGVPGPWHERLPHFRLDFTPSSGDELQTEYLVPRERSDAALDALERLAPRIHPLLHVSEIRTMCADDLWLSGAYGRDTVAVHFTWQKRPEVLALLPAIDEALGAEGGRPHWGKLYAADRDSLVARYPRFDDFAALVGRWDPTGRFGNAMLDDLLGRARSNV